MYLYLCNQGGVISCYILGEIYYIKILYNEKLAGKVQSFSSSIFEQANFTN